MEDGWRRGMSRKSSLHLQRRSKAVQVGKEFGVHPKGVTRLDFCFGKMEGRRSGCMWGREVGSSEESQISSRQHGCLEQKPRQIIPAGWRAATSTQGPKSSWAS